MIGDPPCHGDINTRDGRLVFMVRGGVVNTIEVEGTLPEMFKNNETISQREENQEHTILYF